MGKIVYTVVLPNLSWAVMTMLKVCLLVNRRRAIKWSRQWSIAASHYKEIPVEERVAWDDSNSFSAQIKQCRSGVYIGEVSSLDSIPYFITAIYYPCSTITLLKAVQRTLERNEIECYVIHLWPYDERDSWFSIYIVRLVRFWLIFYFCKWIHALQRV